MQTGVQAHVYILGMRDVCLCLCCDEASRSLSGPSEGESSEEEDQGQIEDMRKVVGELWKEKWKPLVQRHMRHSQSTPGQS